MTRKISKGYWKIPGKAVLRVSIDNSKKSFEIESVSFRDRQIRHGFIPICDYATWDYTVTRITKKEYFLAILSLKERRNETIDTKTISVYDYGIEAKY